MPIDKETIIQRIDYLIELANKSGNDVRGAGEVMSGTISLLESLYGPMNLKCKAYIDRYNSFLKQQEKGGRDFWSIVTTTSGTLKSKHRFPAYM